MPDWCWPWAIRERFKGSQDQIRRIRDDLYWEGLDLQTPEPSSEELSFATGILDSFHTSLTSSTSETPWIIAASNSTSFISKMENIIPVTFALSFKQHIAVIDTDKLERISSLKRFTDDTEDAGLARIQKAGLLVHQHPERILFGFAKSTAKVCNLLDKHWKLKRVALFTCQYPRNIDPSGARDWLETALASSLGESLSAIILEATSLLIFHSESLSSRASRDKVWSSKA